MMLNIHMKMYIICIHIITKAELLVFVFVKSEIYNC